MPTFPFKNDRRLDCFGKAMYKEQYLVRIAALERI